MVQILLFATLREKYNTKKIELNTSGTLEEVIKEAAEKLGEDFFYEVFDPKTGEPRTDRIIMVNGRNIKHLPPNIKVNKEDTIAIFPPVAGG